MLKSKKYKTTTTLVIVESPAKCKKIEEYLGPGYKCVATYGHLRDIGSLQNIDIENNFNPTYTIIDNPIKIKQIATLKKEIKKADEVILGLDADREGEKIAFCVAQLFKLDTNKTKRITFNEITEAAIQYAIKNPRTIDMDLVNAQQARQILDILVGFKISPILWKFMPKNKDIHLSAGRCQTPALKIIYDNEQDAKQTKERIVYNTLGYFTNCNIAFELNKQFENIDEVTVFLKESINFEHIYTCSKPITVHRSPPLPFSTSRIQQVSSNELHYSPKETMRICQILYEAGYITYMRTDSQKYSEEFINLTKDYIVRKYDLKYVNENIDASLVRKNESVLKDIEAHEAIRPTNISLYELPETMDAKEKKMYKLIWTNTLESCMSPASFYSVTANISAVKNTQFTYTSELINFPGWKIVTKKYVTDSKEFQYLQTIKQNSAISYNKMYSNATTIGVKQHYTEARLVQLLEEKGIGRPSTFSSLIDKIQERGYVKKEDIKGTEIVCKDFELQNKKLFEIEIKREFGNEKNKLVIQPIGTLVIEFIEKYFNELFNYDYTKVMEESLDKIAKNDLIWHELCKKCNEQIDTLIDNLKSAQNISETNLKNEESAENKTQMPAKKSQYNLGKYNGEDVILKKGKFGLYITWGENSKTIKELGNRPIENVTFEEIKKYLVEGSNLIREINSSTSIRKGSKGNYLFYRSPKMKKPQFYDISTFTLDTNEDYKICNINILKLWLKDKYNI